MLGLSEVVVMGAGLLFLALCLFVLGDILATPAADFERIGRNKVLWILAFLVFSFFTVIAYMTVVRPELKRSTGLLPG